MTETAPVALVVVTLAQVRSPSKLPEFLGLSQRCVQAALQTTGNLGVEIRARRPLTWCTMTGWSSEEALHAFVRCESHLRALSDTDRFLSYTAFARFCTIERVDGRLWQRAFTLLDAATIRPTRSGAVRPDQH